MTREQIEQAAKDYAYKTWAGGGFECASNDSFIAGAQWRINSVWHNADEIPKRNGMMIPLTVDSDFFLIKYLNMSDWNKFCEDNRIVKYAYVDDLLPERKEATE